MLPRLAGVATNAHGIINIINRSWIDGNIRFNNEHEQLPQNGRTMSDAVAAAPPPPVAVAAPPTFDRRSTMAADLAAGNSGAAGIAKPRPQTAARPTGAC